MGTPPGPGKQRRTPGSSELERENFAKGWRPVFLLKPTQVSRPESTSNAPIGHQGLKLSTSGRRAERPPADDLERTGHRIQQARPQAIWPLARAEGLAPIPRRQEGFPAAPQGEIEHQTKASCCLVRSRGQAKTSITVLEKPFTWAVQPGQHSSSIRKPAISWQPNRPVAKPVPGAERSTSQPSSRPTRVPETQKRIETGRGGNRHCEHLRSIAFQAPGS